MRKVNGHGGGYEGGREGERTEATRVRERVMGKEEVARGRLGDQRDRESR